MSGRILVIEDHSDTALMLAEVLEDVGYSVTTASTGNAGLQQVAQVQPRLILCDMVLPGIGGLGVYAELQRDHRTAAIPLVLMTALLPREAEARLQRANTLLPVLYKPISLNRLIQAVDEYVECPTST